MTIHRNFRARVAAAALALGAAASGPAFAQSSRVALVTNPFTISGGFFPTTTTGPTGSFNSFTFIDMPVASLTLANLTGGICGAQGCDTIVLAVGSAGLNCNVNGVLTSTQKTLLNTFVQNGGKLIIYDSECPTQNYSWLAYPFTTQNPGPEGQRGLLNIVENNALSSKVLSDTTYIDEVSLETSGDAVGDGNVMTTQHAAWCLDMSATNSANVTGPLHTYARYGNGLFIYAGFDLDPMGGTAVPNSANGSPGNLAKIWLQQLQVPFNPTPASALPCGIAVIGITLAPLSATNDLAIGQNSHTVTATLTDLLGAHQSGIPVVFSVTSGPNVGANATIATNVNGEASFTYASNGTLGTDQISACFTNQGNQVCAQVATKTWIQQLPQLSLAKSASPPTYDTVGQVITYGYVISNTGLITANGPFAVNDDKASVTCPATATLAPAASIACAATYAITQGDLDAGSVTNVATASNGQVTSAPASATVNAVQTRQLTLGKTAAPATYAAVGQGISYSYTVTNTGNVTLSGPFAVSDDKATVTCPATPSLTPGAFVVCTASYLITQNDLDVGSVTNQATASNGTITSAPATATVTAIQTRTLSLQKQAAPATYNAVGNTIDYTYTVTNAGNVTLPGPFSVTDDKATVTCPPTATLAPASAITCNATHAITQGDLDAGTLTNTATATNGPVTSLPATATVTAVQTRQITLAKSASPTTYTSVGQIVSYVYTVTNTGNVTLDGPFAVTDDHVTVTCPATASLAPGAAIACTAGHAITQDDLDAGSVTNQATVSNGPVTSSPVTATVTAIQTRTLSLVKSASPATYNAVGNTVSYSYVVTNTGNVTLAGPFTVADDKVTVTCPPAATLSPAASITCTASHAITQADLDAGSLTNQATAANGLVTSNPATATVTAVQVRQLTLLKTAAPASYATVGQSIAYTYVITNTGNVTLNGPFTVADDKATATCPAAATLAPAASVTCTATYAITQADLDAGSVTNTATASNPLVTSAPASATVTAAQTRQITLTKTPAPATFTTVGQAVTYTYVITNSGNVTLAGPFGITDDKATVNCPPAATLAPGGTLTCAATYAITQADLDAGSVTNTAVAANATTTSAPASATVTAIQTRQLSLLKTAAPTSFNAVGQTIAYTYVISNTGNVTLPGPFSVTDDKVSVTCPAAATLAPAATLTCTASHVITQANLDAGTVTNTATASNGPVTSASATATAAATQAPGITLDKTASPGSFNATATTITYSYKVINSGNVTLAGPFTVTDDKVTVTCPATATLAPAAFITCTAGYATVQADLDAGGITNTASASGTFGGNPVVSTPDTVTVAAVQTPRLSLGKSASPGTFTGDNQTITFTLVAGNTGNVDLHDVTIADPLLGGLACTPAQPAALAPGGVLSCTGTYVVTAADLLAGAITNTAGVTGVTPQNQPVGATATTTVQGVLSPHISIVKTAEPIAYNAIGQVITFTIVASNDGNAPLLNVTISDPTVGPLTCNPAQPLTLLPGQSVSCTATHTVVQADLLAGQISNTATAAGIPPNGIPVNAQAQINVPFVVTDSLGLRLALTACTVELQQDWVPRYTTLQFEIWNEDEVKFTGAFECSDGWHETRFGTDFDASRQNFTFAVLGTDTARYRVQAVTSAQCPGSRAVGLLGVQTQLVGQVPRTIGTTLAGAGKFPGSVKWDPWEVVPEGGIR